MNSVRAYAGETTPNSAPCESPLIVIEPILKDVTLRKVDGTWVVLYHGNEYIRLLDAKSREDAEQQVCEMLLLRATRPATHLEASVN